MLHKLVPPSQILFGTDIPYPSSNLVDQQVDALFIDLALGLRQYGLQLGAQADMVRFSVS